MITIEEEELDESERDIVYVDCCGKNFNSMEEIPVTIERDIMGESIDSFRNIILDTINQLKSTIDFLENEITGKNLLIKYVNT